MTPLRILAVGWLSGLGAVALLAFLWLVYPPAVLGAVGAALLFSGWRLSQIRDKEL